MWEYTIWGYIGITFPVVGRGGLLSNVDTALGRVALKCGHCSGSLSSRGCTVQQEMIPNEPQIRRTAPWPPCNA